MKPFEYRVESIDIGMLGKEEVQILVNAIARGGWRLIAVWSGLLFFERAPDTVTRERLALPVHSVTAQKLAVRKKRE